jgi:hypothetical protein
MTSNDKNIVRAKKIVDSWPEWKKNIQLTKYKSPSKEGTEATIQRKPQLQCS